MLSPRLTNCPECTDIPSLISEIDCKLSEISMSLYNDLIFMLHKQCNIDLMLDLLMYKRILTYKYCNPNYAGHFSVNMIASKVKLLKYK